MFLHTHMHVHMFFVQPTAHEDACAKLAAWHVCNSLQYFVKICAFMLLGIEGEPVISLHMIIFYIEYAHKNNVLCRINMDDLR